MEQFLVNGICRGAVYALVASGFSLIYVTTRIFHIAHAAVCVTAAYAAFACLTLFNASLFPTLLVASVAAAASGVGLELIVYRPLTKGAASPLVLLVSSLGANVILTHLLSLLLGNEPRVLSPGAQATITFSTVTLTHSQLLQLGILLPLGFMYSLVLARTRIGHLCQATADNSVLVSVLGYDVQRIRVLVFFVGSALSGLATTLFVLDIGFDPRSGMSLLLSGAVAAIIGGLRSPLGPLLGGLTLGLAQGITAWSVSSRWDAAVTFILLLVFLLWRPVGLIAPTVRTSPR